MFLPCTRLDLGKFYLDYAAEVKIVSTWKNLTDTCTLVFPRPIKYGDEKLQDLVKRGDEVAVQLGYDNVLSQRFTGYVDVVKPNREVEIKCQDEMWKWKQVPVAPKNFQNATLKDILDYAGFTNYELLGDVKLVGSFLIDRTIMSAAGVLEKIKKDVFMPSFFRNGKLYVGKPYNTALGKEVLFAFNHNIISHDLEYKRKDEIKIKITAISKRKTGKDLKVHLGDNLGEEHTLHFYEISEEELKRRATELMEQLKYDGWRGKFLAFGEPLVEHGDVVKLIDPDSREKDGKYYVEKVETKCGVGGYRQEVTVGLKAA